MTFIYPALVLEVDIIPDMNLELRPGSKDGIVVHLRD